MAGFCIASFLKLQSGNKGLEYLLKLLLQNAEGLLISGKILAFIMFAIRNLKRDVLKNFVF